MDLNLRGGVILIGSLYWEEIKIRKDWRDNSLSKKQAVKIALPMRYGRISSTRHYTYTMVLSMNCPKPGVGYAIPFCKLTTTVEDLKRQSLTVASAERNKKYDSEFDWDWGALGILLNPGLASRALDLKALKDSWTAWHSTNFSPAKYKLGKTEEPSIDKTGTLLFEWPKEVNLDFLVATVIEPNVKRYPSAKQNANAMYHASCYNYFIQNRRSGIETFQDQEILQLLKTKYDLTSYLRENGIACELSMRAERAEGQSELRVRSCFLQARVRDRWCAVWNNNLNNICLRSPKTLVEVVFQFPVNSGETDAGRLLVG